MADIAANQEKWYALTDAEVAQKLGVDPARGLSAAEVQSRQQQYGSNVLAGKAKEPGWRAFLRQYQDFMQIILVIAAVINQVFTQELGTTIVLLGLTVFNAVLGLNQESKAEASLAALEKMMKNIARVRRDGQAVEVDSAELVPGDVVLMEAGNRVPADGRLFVTATLEIEEAALTGESVASPKDNDVINKDDVPLGDRHNMAFMNTSVTRGRGEMIVTTTGMGTEMGHIADLLNKTEADKTPLQKQLDRLTIIIAALAGVTFLIMIFLGLRQGQSFDAVFMAGIALAISAIPTGMPAVVTTLYSMGTRTLAEHNAIVKRLPSVETLGSVSAICSDKTGTLTLNKMTAREFTVPGQNRYKVTGEGYSTQGELLHAGGTKINLDEIMLPMALCADARLDGEALIGDPTEGALIVLAEKGGISVEQARERYPRVAEVPFDSDYKFMATFHNMTDLKGKPVVRAFVKGAPDVLIARGGSYWMPEGEVMPLAEENRPLALQENDRMAAAGERVMVVARRDFDPATFDPKGKLIDLMQDLTLLAMVGIVDPPRPEARDAIAQCHSAGIQVRMITGDHAVTAAAIGKELGITGKALTGAQFKAMSDEQLTKELDDIGVIARVAPEDKIRLVDLLQRKQNIVAMTGDGVNDAPALKKADIGVAMGITGTEVSKDAAVMILTDDNFATIVKAVEFGRAIYDNLSKYIRFQMAMLSAFILSYLGASIFGILGGVPFSPLVVLFVNFLIQVPIAIALGFDKPLPGLMERKPRPLSQPVLSRSQWIRLIFTGLLIAVGTLLIERQYEAVDLALAATMGFVVFSLFNVALGLSARSETGTIFVRDTVGDRRQVQLYGLALLLTLLATELGFIQRILGTVSLSLDQWLLCIGLAFVLILIDEAIKFFMRRRRGGDSTQTAPQTAGQSVA
ncbi:MAG: cation-translocating P-type ATPase [Anaerolineae bacterium]|nr:cation-translocating P-type ATPase [Anaerolineae bacterium]RIK23599.1 MAG: ATPase [Anaerolineae bacterium]